jgi:hypothetical protein
LSEHQILPPWLHICSTLWLLQNRVSRFASTAWLKFHFSCPLLALTVASGKLSHFTAPSASSGVVAAFLAASLSLGSNRGLVCPTEPSPQKGSFPN